MSTNLWIFVFFQDSEVLAMYWDMLTTTGVIASIISTVAAFYLALREHQVVRHLKQRNHDHCL
jgi:hypothetical protein